MGKSSKSALHGSLAAYAFNHPSELKDENGTIPADLITINATVARVKINRDARQLYSPGRSIRFNPCLAIPGTETGMDCTVDWVVGNEVHLRFSTPLATGIHELQSCL